MLPWGHAAFGYLLYSLYSRHAVGRPPVGLSVFALGFGTQFPDLIDKPLSWTVSILPYGRSLSHSLFTLILLVGVLWVLFQYPDQRALTTAFGIGYLSHVIGDGIGPAITGDYVGLGYLLWPLTPVPTGDSRSFIEFFLTLELTPQVFAGLILAVISILVWVYDGMPGIKDLLFESEPAQDPPVSDDL
nr:metal-dependent hydrolase [Halobellus rufus]